MEKKTFQQLTESIEEDLVNVRLHSALQVLGTVLDAVKMPTLKREATALQTDYNRLLHFMADNYADPHRSALHNRFITKTFRILQNLRRHYHVEHENDLYTFCVQSQGGGWKDFPDMPDANPSVEEQDRLFDRIWTSPQLNAHEERRLRLFLTGTTTKVRQYMLSALTLAHFHYFDAAKMRLLLEHAESKHGGERARAMLGVVVSCRLHGAVLSLYPQLQAMVKALLAREDYAGELTELQHQFCLYQEAERMKQKMEHEVIPALIQASQQRAKLGFDETEINLNAPESELGIGKDVRKKIVSGIQEMARMHHEGMDVNLHTFAALKGFPFFRSIGHWLAPFDIERPEAVDFPPLEQMNLCDSDKYSMCLLTSHMPEALRDQLKEISEMANTGENKTSPYPNVLQCLFRLLRISPWRGMWPEALLQPILFLDIPLLAEGIRNHPHYLHTTGINLLRYRHFEQAERHLRLYAEHEGTNAELLAQMAFCLEQTGKFRKAISLFEQARMLEPDNEQTLYHLQFCYAQTSQYAEQLDCLLELERTNPNEPRILTETGLCLMQMQQWEEAQKRFYKMEFKGQRVVPSQRAIAWCALRMKDYATAQKYYDRILGGQPGHAKWEDYLNAAHTQWLQDNTQQALPLYHEYARRYVSANPEAKDALEPYNRDADVLRSLGRSASDIALMHDLIARDL